MDWTKVTTSAFTGLIGALLVITACIESFVHNAVDPAILTLATAVVTTYFTGSAVRQVNGQKVDALTQSVIALHSRLDASGAPPAKDGNS